MSEGILFPVPTLTAALPETVAPPLGTASNHSALYRIAEDEWRQTEFLSLDWQGAIERELSLVRLIRSRAAEPTSFPRMHLRNITGLRGIDLEKMGESLGIRGDSWRRLGFTGRAGIVSNSFAVPFGSCLIYGQQKKGRTESLGLQRGYFSNKVSDDTRFAQFAKAHNCALIDWCAAALALPHTDSFTEYFCTENSTEQP